MSLTAATALLLAHGAWDTRDPLFMPAALILASAIGHVVMEAAR